MFTDIQLLADDTPCVQVQQLCPAAVAAAAPAAGACLQEFHPYVFQILAQLIELSSPPLNAVSWHA